MEKDKVSFQRDVPPAHQVLYLGRFVDKHTFTAFVYQQTEKGLFNEKLAKNYDEYKQLISSGEWFSSKKEVEENYSRKDTNESKKEIDSNDDNEAMAKIKAIKAKNKIT